MTLSNFGPLLLMELMGWSQDCRPSCSHKQVHSSTHSHSITFTLLSRNHFATTLKVCLRSLSVWKTHWQPNINFWVNIFRCCFNIFTNSNFPSSQWCLFYEMHESLLQQSRRDCHPCCHLCASRLEECSSVCKPSLFPPKIMMGIMVNFHVRPFSQNVISSTANKVVWAAFHGMIIKDLFYPSYCCFGISYSIFTKSPAIVLRLILTCIAVQSSWPLKALYNAIL